MTSRTGFRPRRWAAAVAVATLSATAMVAIQPAAQADPTEPGPKSYTSTDQGDGTYTVPLLNADVPDVSVEMVPAAENDEGRDIYYMVSTTMHLSPGAPIMKSYDLVNWDIVNYAYDRLSLADSFSLRNGKNEYGRGQWATSIRHHDGKFYIAFNTNNLGGSYIYVTDDIENGSWERIALGRAFHDPSLFFDPVDGSAYIFYGSGSTSAVKLAPDMKTVVAEYPQILRPADFPGAPVGGLFEGAQVTYIDGQYYIVIITWPSGQGRQVVLFRSPDLLGRLGAAGANTPYEARGVLNSNGFAQGSLVPITQADGSTTYHGFFFRDSFPVGRIPALIPATWTDGWPTFGNATGQAVPVNGAFPKPIRLSPAEENLERLKTLVDSDDFDNDAPHRPWMDEEWEVPPPPSYDTGLLGVELFTNPGFEAGAAGGWILNDSGTLAASTTARTGTGAVLQSGRQSTSSGPAQDITGKLQAGITYTVSAWVRYDNAASPATKRFNLTVRYGSGSFTNFANVTATRGQWAQIRGTITPTAAQAAGTARIFVENQYTANATAQAAPAEYLMDFTVDDASLIGATPPPGLQPAEIAFNGSRLDKVWEWNHAPDNRNWSLTDRDGWLRLTTPNVLTGTYVWDKLSGTPELTYLEEARNTLSQRVFGPTGSVETTLDISGLKAGDTAGLAMYGRGFSYLGVRKVDGVNTVGVVNRVSPYATTFDQAAVEAFLPGTTASLGSSTVVHLKADLELNNPTGQGWTTFYYSLDGQTWTKLGNRVGPQTLDGTLAHFMGHRWGLFNYAIQSAGGHVDVDNFLLSDKLTSQNIPVTTTALDATIAKAQALVETDHPAEQWAEFVVARDKAVAARAAGVHTHNQADAPRMALERQLAELAVLAENAEPTVDLTAVTGSRCVAGKALPTITVTNNEDVPVAVTLTSPFSTRTVAAVQPGRNVFHAFTTRQTSVPAATVVVQASAGSGAEAVSVRKEVAYEAITCN